MKLFTGGLLAETTGFSPLRTGLGDFEPADGKLFGAVVGQMVEVFDRRGRERGWEVVRGLLAGAMPGGVVSRSAYETLRDRMLADLRAALPVDVVMLSLHGAMVADGYDDCEGDLLARIRIMVGPKVPIGVELDPHCNLSEAMVRAADILVMYKEWPHVDMLERANDVFALTEACLEGRIRPRIAVWDCRMLDCFHTMEPPVKPLLDEIRHLEGRDGILSISIVHGYPFGDVPDGGTKMMVISDDQPERGARLAEQLGRRLFAMRGKTRPRHLPLEEGLDAVEQAVRHPVVVADVSDAPGAGAPGDATSLLAGLLRRQIRDVALAYLWDPGMVSLAINAGVGARLPMRLGGKTGPGSGTPLDLECEVVLVVRNHVVPGVQGPTPVGDVAVVRTSGVEIVLSAQRPAAMTSEHFVSLGIDPRARRVLVVKSVNNFRAGFEAVAGQFVYVCPPGTLDTSLSSLPFRRIGRPRWPFDQDPFGATDHREGSR